MIEYENRIKKLDTIVGDYKKYLTNVIKKDNLIIYVRTSLIFSVLQRSLSLIEAYKKLIKTNNIMVLNSLSRMQIDNCIFVYGIFLLIENKEDINELYNNFISNKKEFRNYRINDKNLYDGFIVSKLNEKYPTFKKMYKFYCRFIHCSDSAFLYSTHHIGDDVIEFSLAADYDRYSKDCIINADTFCVLSELLLTLIRDYWKNIDKGNRLSK